jgi:hypothetical protein
VFADKIVVLVAAEGKTAEQGSSAKPFMARIPDYVVEMAGYLFQLTSERGSKLYYAGHSRAAMWGSYLAHKWPSWFAGFLLAAAYPLWKDPESSSKCAKQLVKCKVPITFLYSEKDSCCNPQSHPAYFQWILTADVGPGPAQKSPTFQVFATEYSHEYLENVIIADFRIEEAGAAETTLFENIWASVFGGISDRMHAIQIE